MDSVALHHDTLGVDDELGNTLWQAPSGPARDRMLTRDGAGASRCPEHLTGTLLSDRYRVEERIGDGGMAIVYRGRHTSIGHSVAIKVLRSGISHEPRTVARFLREVQATSRIEHPQVVRVNDFGVTRDRIVYAVMEYLEGEDLGALLRREGALPWPRALAIVEQICNAVQAAHEHGVVHRDIKPRNCFRVETRGTDDFVKLLDFGIAKIVAAGPQEITDGGLTSHGALFGTPEYIAPEQARSADDVDARADIYATGMLLYELLTGRSPFKAKSPMMTLAMQVYETPPPPSTYAPGIPEGLDAVVMHAIEKDPMHRFQTMAELRHALQRAGQGLVLELSSPSWTAADREANALIGRPRWHWLASAATAAICVAGTLGLALPSLGLDRASQALDRTQAWVTDAVRAPEARSPAPNRAPATSDEANPGAAGPLDTSPRAQTSDTAANPAQSLAHASLERELPTPTPPSAATGAEKPSHNAQPEPESRSHRRPVNERAPSRRTAAPHRLPPPPDDHRERDLPAVANDEDTREDPLSALPHPFAEPYAPPKRERPIHVAGHDSGRSTPDPFAHPSAHGGADFRR